MVDLHWQGPKMFSQAHAPGSIPEYKGVYLICSRKGLYQYSKGRSSLAYIGSGDVGDRLDSHISQNPRVISLLDDEKTLRFWYARVPGGHHDCVEQVLFDQFEDHHGRRPLLNERRPPCSKEYGSFVLRHHGLSFPYHFSTSEQFD